MLTLIININYLNFFKRNSKKGEYIELLISNLLVILEVELNLILKLSRYN